MDRRCFVPDELVLNMVRDKLQKCTQPSDQFPKGQGALLDGFPRTGAQAEALARMVKIEKVVFLEASDKILLDRAPGRRVDTETGDIYHVTFNPAPAEISDRLIQRPDDTEETVRSRLEAYHAQTAPLAAWYSERGLLIKIDGNDSIKKVGDSVEAAVSRIL